MPAVLGGISDPEINFRARSAALDFRRLIRVLNAVKSTCMDEGDIQPLTYRDPDGLLDGLNAHHQRKFATRIVKLFEVARMAVSAFQQASW